VGFDIASNTPCPTWLEPFISLPSQPNSQYPSHSVSQHHNSPVFSYQEDFHPQWKSLQEDTYQAHEDIGGSLFIGWPTHGCDFNPLASSHHLASGPGLALSSPSIIPADSLEFFAKETRSSPQASPDFSTTLTSPLLQGAHAEPLTISSPWSELAITQEFLNPMTRAISPVSISNHAVFTQAMSTELGKEIQAQDEKPRQEQRQFRERCFDSPASTYSPSSHSSRSQTLDYSLQSVQIASQPFFRCSSCPFSHRDKETLE
jgi:hypothetical protein